MWQFYLSDDGGLTYIPIEEPDKWSDVEFVLKRGPESSEPWIDGADFVFGYNLTFVRTGARIIKNAYNNFGIDADVRIRLTLSGCAYQFDGFIDFSAYAEQPYCGEDCPVEEITIRIYKSGFAQLFNNRFDSKVDLSKTTGIDGNELSNITGFEVKLHSKEILYTAQYKLNDQLLTVHTNDLPNTDGAGLGVVPPFDQVGVDLEGALAIGFYNPVLDNSFLYSGFTFPPGVTERVIDITNFRLAGQVTPLGNGYVLVYLMSYPTTDGVTPTEQRLLYSKPITSGIANSFDTGFITTSISLPANHNLYLYVIATSGPEQTGNNDIEALYVFDKDNSNLFLSENSIITPSSVYAYTIMNALKKIVESTTGITDGVASDFFSQGCYEYMVITNGLNIRKMRDKEGNLFPVVCSFKELYEALDAIYCLGMSIEKIGETERVRIEHRSFFYSQQVAEPPFDYVPDINMNVSLEHYYNEAEFGYSKWETQDVNGIDEFNSKRSYSLPVKNVKKKLSKLCNFIAGGYLIEQTRRQQFKEKPTSDYSTDNDMFFICTNRVEVTANVYDIDAAGEPVENVYAPGLVSERDELFENIFNLLSPSTSYNLRLSPARMARWHFPLLKVSLYKKTPIVSFQSGTGNYQMISSCIDACKPEEGEVRENYSIGDSSVKEALQNALFIPETMEFSAPMSFEQFLQAVEETIFTYQAGCSNANHLGGYIKSLNFRPNTEGGFGEFVLQRG